MADSGTRCPQCNCQHTKVLKTFYRNVRWGGKQHVHTRRRRECQHCLYCFWTIETLEDPIHRGFPDASSLPEKNRTPPPLKPPSSLPNPFIRLHNDEPEEPGEFHNKRTN